MNHPFWLSHIPNGTRHDDVIFKWREHDWVCDSYFFADDKQASRENDRGAREVIILLLKQWRSLIANAQIGDVLYLPFDLSDQCTKFVRLRFSGEAVEGITGWSDIEGYTFSPSSLGEAEIWFENPSFRPEPGAEQSLTRSELMATLDANIDELSTFEGFPPNTR